MPKSREVRGMSEGEIFQAIEDAKRELFNLRFQRSTGQLENPHRVKIVQRDLARYKTILRERELALQVLQQEGKEKK